MRNVGILAIYLCLSCLWLWKGFSSRIIAGGMSTDIWNSLWNVDFLLDALEHGTSIFHSDRLHAPSGGTLWIPDIPNVLLLGLFVSMLGWGLGYQVWLILQMTLLGFCMHAFARELGAKEGAWLAGCGVIFSGVFLSGIQNGATEGVSLFWIVLSVWFLWRLANHGRSEYWTWFISFVAALTSWYAAVMIAVFACSLWVWKRQKRLLGVMGVWCIALFPLAMGMQEMSVGTNNLIGIKDPKLMEQVRRSIGSADIFSYVAPHPYLFPDFSTFWKFGEDYVHSCYISWIFWLLLLVYRKEGYPWMKWAGGICFVLSLGPVLVHNGAAVLFGNDKGIPLPYFLLEYLWGFGSLTLLYRFSFGVLFCIALHASLVVQGRKAWSFLALMIVEVFLWSPVQILPEWSKFPMEKEFSVLSSENGIVINHPFVGGQPYLFEQILHKKKLFQTVNSPKTVEIQRILSDIEKKGCHVDTYEEPIYIVSHLQIEHMKQKEDRYVQKAIEECTVVYSSTELIIVELK